MSPLFFKLSLDLPIKWMLLQQMVILLPSIAPVDFLQNDDSTNMTVETDKVRKSYHIYLE